MRPIFTVPCKFVFMGLGSSQYVEQTYRFLSAYGCCYTQLSQDAFDALMMGLLTSNSQFPGFMWEGVYIMTWSRALQA